MDRLVVRLLRLLGQRLGWARMLFVVQHETGKVAWSVTPEDLPLSVRVNTDYSLSVTLGHRDPGDSFLAELETLLGEPDCEPGCARCANRCAGGEDAVVRECIDEQSIEVERSAVADRDGSHRTFSAIGRRTAKSLKDQRVLPARSVYGGAWPETSLQTARESGFAGSHNWSAPTARKPPVWRLFRFLALRTPGAHPGPRFAPRFAVRSRGRR